VCRHLLLEQLVEPAVRQLPARSGEPVKLEMAFLGGQQALPPMLGIRIGGNQRECGEVIAGFTEGFVSETPARPRRR
jgi:hypothetical protein